MTDKARRDLEFLSTSIAMEVHSAVAASLVMSAANLLFHEKQAGFVTNPANTLTYSAMLAREEQAIVHLAELLRNPAMAVPPEVRHVKDLSLHRNAASHPYEMVWHTRAGQQFHDEKRKYLDVRAALVWDMKRSVDELLVKAGGTPKYPFQVNSHMVHALRAILQGCLRPDNIAWTNDDVALLAALESFWARYSDFLIRRAPSASPP